MVSDEDIDKGEALARAADETPWGDAERDFRLFHAPARLLALYEDRRRLVDALRVAIEDATKRIRLASAAMGETNELLAETKDTMAERVEREREHQAILRKSLDSTERCLQMLEARQARDMRRADAATTPARRRAWLVANAATLVAATELVVVGPTFLRVAALVAFGLAWANLVVAWLERERA